MLRASDLGSVLGYQIPNSWRNALYGKHLLREAAVNTSGTVGPLKGAETHNGRLSCLQLLAMPVRASLVEKAETVPPRQIAASPCRSGTFAMSVCTGDRLSCFYNSGVRYKKLIWDGGKLFGPPIMRVYTI